MLLGEFAFLSVLRGIVFMQEKLLGRREAEQCGGCCSLEGKRGGVEVKKKESIPCVRAGWVRWSFFRPRRLASGEVRGFSAAQAYVSGGCLGGGGCGVSRTTLFFRAQ